MSHRLLACIRSIISNCSPPATDLQGDCVKGILCWKTWSVILLQFEVIVALCSAWFFMNGYSLPSRTPHSQLNRIVCHFCPLNFRVHRINATFIFHIFSSQSRIYIPYSRCVFNVFRTCRYTMVPICNLMSSLKFLSLHSLGRGLCAPPFCCRDDNWELLRARLMVGISCDACGWGWDFPAATLPPVKREHFDVQLYIDLKKFFLAFFLLRGSLIVHLNVFLPSGNLYCWMLRYSVIGYFGTPSFADYAIEEID